MLGDASIHPECLGYSYKGYPVCISVLITWEIGRKFTGGSHYKS